MGTKELILATAYLGSFFFLIFFSVLVCLFVRERCVRRKCTDNEGKKSPQRESVLLVRSIGNVSPLIFLFIRQMDTQINCTAKLFRKYTSNS